MRASYNKGMHPTKGARSGRFAADHLEAPFAGYARCSTHMTGPTFTADRASKKTSLIPVGTMVVAAPLPRRGFYGGMAAVAPESQGGGKGSPWSGW